MASSSDVTVEFHEDASPHTGAEEDGSDLEKMRKLHISAAAPHNLKNSIGGAHSTSTTTKASASAPAAAGKVTKGQNYSYTKGKVLGNGSFGVVCQGVCVETSEIVAVKKVLQDPRYKNRELDIMKLLDHQNVVTLRDYYFSEVAEEAEGKDGAKNLNVVMEFLPETVYRVVKYYTRTNSVMPMISVKLYTYQICRALGYLHSLGICHRDVKPQNLLVDPTKHILKVCDFGSAKKLVKGEVSVAYICSRYYRAPELMLGATEYDTSIDVWSIGCVLGEMLLGRPLFPGETSVDQLVKIIQTLGTPSREQMNCMNPNYTDFRFPEVKPRPWAKVFPANVPSEALDLVSQLLRYEPADRLNLYVALGHSFFDELRHRDTRLPGGRPLPELFDFSEVELKLIPAHLRAGATGNSNSNKLKSGVPGTTTAGGST